MSKILHAMVLLSWVIHSNHCPAPSLLVLIILWHRQALIASSQHILFIPLPLQFQGPPTGITLWPLIPSQKSNLRSPLEKYRPTSFYFPHGLSANSYCIFSFPQLDILFTSVNAWPNPCGHLTNLSYDSLQRRSSPTPSLSITKSSEKHHVIMLFLFLPGHLGHFPLNVNSPKKGVTYYQILKPSTGFYMVNVHRNFWTGKANLTSQYSFSFIYSFYSTGAVHIRIRSCWPSPSNIY